MKLTHAQVVATDLLLLPGLLYEPDTPSKKLVIWLHGMGDSGVFYKPDKFNTLGSALTNNGWSLLAFNNRGAYNTKTLKYADDREQRFQGGTYYELIEDCVQDIDGAVSFAEKLGYTELVLAGSSTGANKICVYDYLKQGQTDFNRYILADPGDDSGLFYQELGANAFEQIQQSAPKKVAEGKGLETVSPELSSEPFSWQSMLDITNPDGLYNSFPFYEATQQRLGTKTLFLEWSKITTPSLVLLGEEDEYAADVPGTAEALELFKEYANPSASHQYMLASGANHGFKGSETQLAKHILTYLGGTNAQE